MKKSFLFALLSIVFGSCSTDDGIRYTSELLPIETITLPAEFKRDSLYEIPMQYIRPSTCHVYEGIYYRKEANIRTIAIGTSVLEQNNCTTAPINPLPVLLRFIPTTEDSYVFKVWKGKDANGINIFEETEIKVVP
jgi:hypothetical protein